MLSNYIWESIIILYDLIPIFQFNSSNINSGFPEVKGFWIIMYFLFTFLHPIMEVFFCFFGIHIRLINHITYLHQFCHE